MASRLFLLNASSAFRNPVIIGSAIGLVGATLYNQAYTHRSSIIANNTAVFRAQQSSGAVTYQPRTTGLRQYLNYQHLTIGSMLGLVSGFVVGKISKVLVMLVVAGYLTTQFLVSRGITVAPAGTTAYLSNTVMQWGKDKVSLRYLLLEDPSFKVSFISAFSVAAIYA